MSDMKDMTSINYGEGVSTKKLGVFPDLNLNVTVAVFAPGAVARGFWEDPHQPMNPQTYFRSHVPLTGAFRITTKFVEGPDESVIVEVGRSWPDKEVRAGFRQVVAHPLKIEAGGEHLCVIPTDTQKYFLSCQMKDLEKGESLAVQPGALLFVNGTKYLINGVERSSVDSPWSVTACVKRQAVVKAEESCQVLLYRAVPHSDLKTDLRSLA